MKVTNGKDLIFLYSPDGKSYQQLNNIPVDGSFLPPWDRSLRVGLLAKGDVIQQAGFDNFQLINE